MEMLRNEEIKICVRVIKTFATTNSDISIVFIAV